MTAMENHEDAVILGWCIGIEELCDVRRKDSIEAISGHPKPVGMTTGRLES